MLVRLLFCLFADDTAIFPQRGQFQLYLDTETREDGSDLGMHLSQLFQVLNTAENHRQKSLNEVLAAFPYVNGKLFAESLQIPSFDGLMRESLLDCAALDWSRISPAIFGSLFQSIMDKKARRNLGAHYTSETNILKALKPLFLDELRAELETLRNKPQRLMEFHQKLASITVFDPACGCGNFLVIAYRELRLLELDVLRQLHKSMQTRVLDAGELIWLNVDRFHGIEIEEFPGQIAQVALWLTDHQLNLLVSEEFGQYFARLPLKTAPHIVYGQSALALDWAQVIPPEKLSYIVGNPPFIGAKLLSDVQRQEVDAVFHDTRNAGLLDYVACWYRKAVDYMAGNPAIRAALVSTNSITQGEQVGVLWSDLLARGVHIHFAHRTFQWSSEARGKAAVHCVIIGFGLRDTAEHWLYDYETVKSEPMRLKVGRINPYLINGPDILAEARMAPISPVTFIANGSIPADGGNLILSISEKDALLGVEPQAEQWLRPYLGAEGFIGGEIRYCLWLVDCPPASLRAMPHVRSRVDGVRKMRLESAKEATQNKAEIPMLFTENRQPVDGFYLAIPRTSSENRRYIPIGFLSSEVIAANDLQIVPNASLFEFGILTSSAHIGWARVTSGRMKSDIRYSVKLTYNTFPWPEPTDKQRTTIETAAQAVLDARAHYPTSTLADLYDPLTMPPELVKAHHALDRAVDAAYGKKGFASEAERVAFLFERYQQITSLLPVTPPKRSHRPAE